MALTSHGRRLAVTVLALVLSVAWFASDAAGAAVHLKRPLIVFLSDFGTIDDAVAICKGAMVSVAPDVEIIDLTHQVTPYSIVEGARLLARTAPYYPVGTVFVAVVDPGVGTSRKPIVVKTQRGQYFVLPDNGLVTPLVDRDGLVGAREIRNPAWLLGGKLSSTFHGRDVFSPVAAQVGPAMPTLERLETPRAVVNERGITGSVVALDGPYGNLVTNIDGNDFRQLGYAPGDVVRVKVGAETVTAPFAATFGDVPLGKELVFIDSRGLLSLAINQGNFARSHGVNPPVELVVFRK
jgi:S-adenosyl-L-methionine hydrolase (adenosine-forming)